MSTKAPPYDTGVIHGRFQILHNDHLKYLLAGKALCRHLIVGITNPDPFTIKAEATDPLRHSPRENPLTYYERYCMIKTVLLDAGIGWDEFSIVPLPINLPERYRYYVPSEAVYFLSIYDDWGRRKLQYFNNLGLTVHVLWEVPREQKGISGKEVRQRIIDGQPWQHLVPACIPPMMAAWGIAQRLKS